MNQNASARWASVTRIRPSRRLHTAAIGLLMLATSVAMLPPQVSAAAEPQSPEEKATFWSQEFPGLQVLGVSDRGIAINSDDGPKMLNQAGGIKVDYGIDELNRFYGDRVGYCAPDEFLLFPYVDFASAATPTQYLPSDAGVDEFQDCLYSERNIYIIGTRNGDPVLRHMRQADPGNWTDIEFESPASLKHMQLSYFAVINTAGEAFQARRDVFSGVVEFNRRPSLDGEFVVVDRRYQVRSGETVSEYGNSDEPGDSWTIPGGAAAWAGRFYAIDNQNGPELVTESHSFTQTEFSRTLPLTAVPDSMHRLNDDILLVQGSTLTAISTEVVSHNLPEFIYDGNSKEWIDIPFWADRPGPVYIRTGDGANIDIVAGDINAPVTVEEIPGGISVLPPLLSAGEYIIRSSSVELVRFTVTSGADLVPFTVSVGNSDGPYDVSGSVTCYVWEDRYRTTIHFAQYTPLPGGTTTFDVVKGSTCKLYASQRNSSWGPVIDGVHYDYMGYEGDTIAVTEPLQYAVHQIHGWEVFPIWVYPFRSGGATQDVREIKIHTFEDGVHSIDTHTVPYDKPTRILVDRDADERYLEAVEPDDADLTLISVYTDHEPEASAHARSVMELGRFPGWFEVGDLLIHPNDDNGQFVIQSYKDFLGRDPNPTELYNWTTDLNSGKQAKPALVLALLKSVDYTTTIEPNIRLYRAFFDRLPDSGGLKYWFDVRGSGYPLESVSDQFTLSQEFQNLYGNTTDRAFIKLVYQNVLKREPDADGYKYWQDLLEGGAITRGELMVYFSESQEYRQTWSAEVQVVSIYFAILARVPTSAELNASVGDIHAGTNTASLLTELLASPEYDARFRDHYRGTRIEDLIAGTRQASATGSTCTSSMPPILRLTQC